MRNRNLSSEAIRLTVALAVITVALIATVMIGRTAGWRALAALPGVLASVSLLVKTVVGEAEPPTSSPPDPRFLQLSWVRMGPPERGWC